MFFLKENKRLVSRKEEKREPGHAPALVSLFKGVTFNIMAQSEKSVEKCAAAPLPSRGGARGGVCNVLYVKKILTPPPSPPLHGRGEPRPSYNGIIGLNQYYPQNR
jgi:hypothetical protein